MTYRGEVKNGVVVLEGESRLAEGTKVQVRPIASTTEKVSGESLADYLRRMGPGTRTKEDIDQQIREERDWGD